MNPARVSTINIPILDVKLNVDLSYNFLLTDYFRRENEFICANKIRHLIRPRRSFCENISRTWSLIRPYSLDLNQNERNSTERNFLSVNQRLERGLARFVYEPGFNLPIFNFEWRQTAQWIAAEVPTCTEITLDGHQTNRLFACKYPNSSCKVNNAAEINVKSR